MDACSKPAAPQTVTLPDNKPEPLLCRWGFHSWSIWSAVAHAHQFRCCVHCRVVSSRRIY